MSIWSNLYIGTSGLNAHGTAISVVGDNIANVSTVGFKASRADFAEVLGGTAGNQRLGGGVAMGSLQTLQGQGSLMGTGVSLDLAVKGRGFFAVAGNHDGQTGTFFTRDGRFGLDANGYVTNPSGLRLQGYTIDANGVTSPQLGDLPLGAAATPPRATTITNMIANLDAAAVPPAAFDPADPANTSNFATSATVYDSLGGAHRVDIYFRTDGGGAWEWHAMVDSGELGTPAGTPGTPTQIADGNLTFLADGSLDTEVVNSSSADFTNALAGQVITFDFGDSITTDGGTGLAGTTQFAGDSTVTGLTQDGFGFGSLVDVKVNEDGTIEGSFSNGETRSLARVALALFAADDGLTRLGDQMFGESINSGQPLFDTAASGGRGSLSAGNLEASNVDLTNELVTLIAYQRAFQANTKTVQTADEMLQEIANLKR